MNDDEVCPCGCECTAAELRAMGLGAAQNGSERPDPADPPSDTQNVLDLVCGQMWGRDGAMGAEARP
jgi:hypothetical protein